jgi:drug/metabolite transporter (DMT)-like permease
MNFLLPFIVAANNSLGTILDKYNFLRTRISARSLMAVEFLFIFITVGVALLIVRPPVMRFDATILGILVIIIVVSFVQNILEYKGIQVMPLPAREPISDLYPVVVGVMAYAVFPSERDVKYLLAIIACILVLYWGNMKRHSWKAAFSRGSGYVFLYMILGAVLANIYKVALLEIRPEYITFFRTGAILLLSVVFLRPRLSHIPARSVSLSLLSGFFFGTSAIIELFAIQYLGLNRTILLTMIGPGLIYALSYVALKEKVHPRQVISSLVILAIILLTQYV